MSTAADPSDQLLDRLRRHRVVGIVRHADPAVAAAIARAMLHGGLACVEITWTVPRATEVIAGLAEEFGDRYIGAGTVVQADQVDAVADAGARYVVTPAVRPAVVARCAERGIPTLTGIMTPTDLYAAIDLGVRAVKVFPAGTLGVGHLAALKEIAPQVAYVPTGGVRRGLGRGVAGAGRDGGGDCVGVHLRVGARRCRRGQCGRGRRARRSRQPAGMTGLPIDEAPG